ncbi:thiol:disulfide interchange protein DsbA/DsbL [Marinobacter sp. LN3S78]|uniref:thiol:disulfide interchange protein DsbA/DsbL n=1 Tax=Marinobacter sp. LN3S78 TaxID=3382300 RepID=UPI00387AB85D
MGIFRSLAAGVIAATVAFSASAQDQWVEGEHYERLSTEVSASSGEGIEVVEVFWYGCGHCNDFEPFMQAWKKDIGDDVNLVLLPAPMNKAAVQHAYAYYATEAIGATDKTHEAFYTALAEERQDLTSASALADFVETQGVDREAFLKAFNSFGVKAQVQRGMSVLRGAQVRGTPTMLVAGKYKTGPGMTGGHAETLEVVDYLIEKERSESTD